MLKNVLQIRKINKNMSLLLEKYMYFFEIILSEISHKKYKPSKKYICNKYMGSSLSYSLVIMHELNKKKINKLTKLTKTITLKDHHIDHTDHTDNIDHIDHTDNIDNIDHIDHTYHTDKIRN